ncbi:MAG: thioesterase [Arcobacter sp.]|nr:MAG: thioesterase [Arcobacter sp.]
MLKELENKLHSEIPMTKYMELKVKSIDEEKIITTIPLKPNINDKGTGFAGSLSTLVTISAWCSCFLEVKKLGYKKSMIAIIKSDTSYKAPVTKDMNCITTVPSKEQINILEKKLKEKGSASLRIKSQIIQDDQICVNFEGIYVIKV